jgi:hypothetical protein
LLSLGRLISGLRRNSRATGALDWLLPGGSTLGGCRRFFDLRAGGVLSRSRSCCAKDDNSEEHCFFHGKDCALNFFERTILLHEQDGLIDFD